MDKRRSTVLKKKIIRILDADFGQRYSKETLESFRLYSRSPNVILKTIFNCLLLAVVPFLIFLPSIAFDMDDISVGLSGRNWNQISVMIIGSINACNVNCSRYKTMVPNSRLKIYHYALAYFCFTLSAVVSLILVEKFLVYPVPFALLFTAQVGCPVLFGVLLWFERFEWSKVKASVWKFGISLGTSVSLFASHQFISVLYASQTDPIAQSIVALFLPGIKFFYRFLVSKSLGEDFQKLALISTVFEIEFFNTLYTSVFMQTFRVNYAAKKIKKKIKSEKEGEEGLRRILCQTELVVLVELVEVVTPILYMAFLITFRQVHNLKYVEALAAMTDDQFHATLWNLAVLTAFELLSLITFIGSLKLRFDLPAFTQMGFFISNNKFLILPLMTMWFTVAAGIDHVHMGMDLTFTFDSKYFHFV